MKPVSSLFPPKPKEPLVRLVDGKSKQEGRVEVFYDGQWGTVCDDDWDLKEAAIVCKELGFGKAVQAPKHSRFGKGKFSFKRYLNRTRWFLFNAGLKHGSQRYRPILAPEPQVSAPRHKTKRMEFF